MNNKELVTSYYTY